MTAVTTPIPEELRTLTQWVVWRIEDVNGRPTKVPYNPYSGHKASTTDPNTWSSYGGCVKAVRSGKWSGLGFVFSDDDPYTGVDLDGCLIDGVLSSTADRIMKTLDSYTEISPSGTGLHIIVKGTPNGTRKRKGHVEMYCAARYFTMTGEGFYGARPTIESRHRELNAIYQEFVADKPPASQPASPNLTPTFDDQSLMEKIRQSNQGRKFEQLVAGNTSEYAGDDSSADIALCDLLAFWTTDAQQIDRIVRQSGLYRPKWDARRGESTYGSQTIQNALKYVTEHYAPFSSAAPDTARPIAVELELLRREIVQLRSELRSLKDDNLRLKDERSMMLQAIRNPNLNGEGATGVAVAFEVASAESRNADDDGFVTLPLSRIAEKAGVSATTASKHLKRLEACGVLRRRVKRIAADRVDQQTGEIRTGYTSELQIQLIKPAKETLKDLATLQTDAVPKWGGKRLTCPHHPNADLIVRRTIECAVCGEVLDEKETRKRPEIVEETVNLQDAISHNDEVDEWLDENEQDAISQVTEIPDGQNRTPNHGRYVKLQDDNSEDSIYPPVDSTLTIGHRFGNSQKYDEAAGAWKERTP